MSQLPFIGESPAFYKQKYEWWELPDKELIEIEIIGWGKVRNVSRWESSRQQTIYCNFIAKICKPLKTSKIDELVEFDIPYKTFERSIASADISMKRDILKANLSDNIFISFKKYTKRRMEILELYAKPEDSELTDKADRLRGEE